MLGHYRDDRTGQLAEQQHHDWLTSGSNFGPKDFDALMGAIAAGMLRT